MCFSRRLFSSRLLTGVLILAACFHGLAHSQDLDEIKQRGVLRHLGIPYANFVTTDGGGFDVEIMQLFAKQLNVRYEYIRTDWQHALSDLTGKAIKVDGERVEFLGEAPVRGDLIASGLTMLPWRQTIADFSHPTFPTGVWLIARADSPLQPIQPSGDIQKDIAEVKKILAGRSVLGLKFSCLDPALYDLEQTGAEIKLPAQATNPDDMVPTMLSGTAEATLLDVPEALLALEKWPGQIKIIGPVSTRQEMGVAFTRQSPQLRQAFNDFLQRLKENGAYLQLVNKYYPMSAYYFSDYFNTPQAKVNSALPAP